VPLGPKDFEGATSEESRVGNHWKAEHKGTKRMRSH